MTGSATLPLIEKPDIVVPDAAPLIYLVRAVTLDLPSPMRRHCAMTGAFLEAMQPTPKGGRIQHRLKMRAGSDYGSE